MIKYRINDAFVEENEFYEALIKRINAVNNMENDYPCPYIRITNALNDLKREGKYFLGKGFFVADEEVFEIERLLINIGVNYDEFGTALKLHQAGYKITQRSY